MLVLEKPGAMDAAQWSGWAPGQFVMVRPPEWTDLTWGRPLSICTMDADTLTLFFQVAGRGTARLAAVKPGDSLVVWGPLGNTFAMEPNTPTLILAGGIGVAPFVGYVLRHPTPEKLTCIFGHRAPLELYPPFDTIVDRIAAQNHWERSSADLEVFINLLRERIAQWTDGLVLACGPSPFLRTVQAIAAETGARCQLSLENKMGCGVGACMGCVTTYKGGWPITVCNRGPVFWAQDVSLEARS